MSGDSSERKPHLGALILAAGYSSRMGQLKALLPVGYATVIESAIELFREAGISDITVVTGYRAKSLATVLDRQRVHIALNSHYDQGMFSSIVAGVRSLPHTVEACFVLPCDMVLVRPRTIQRLSEAYARRPADVLYPVFQGRRGHPPLVSHRVLAETFAHDGAGGLRAILAKHETAARTVKVLDEGILWDMDTPEDFAKVAAMFPYRDSPSPLECDFIFERLKVPERVVRHSKAVSQVAFSLASALSTSNLSVDPGLICAGSLLHDVAKGKPKHARVGARIAKWLGFPAVAAVISRHQNLDFSGSLDEAAIVYLADKLVRGEQIVSIEERFKPAFARIDAMAASRDPALIETLAAVIRRRDAAKNIAREIERRTGAELQQLLATALAKNGSELPCESTLVGI